MSAQLPCQTGAQLTTHFSLYEAIHSDKADELGLDNSPTPELLAIVTIAARMLEAVRERLGQPMHIDSWLRMPVVNAAVGGAHNSAHLDGWAIDFTCPAFGDPDAIVKFLIATDLRFDQLIVEGAANGHSGWVHISFAPAMRRQVLTAHFVLGQNTTYTMGA